MATVLTILALPGLLLVPSPPAAAGAGPSLSMRSTLEPGAKVWLTGSGFEAGERGVVALDGAFSTPLGEYAAGSKGKFRLTVVMPRVDPLAQHRISANRPAESGFVERASLLFGPLGATTPSATPTPSVLSTPPSSAPGATSGATTAPTSASTPVAPGSSATADPTPSAATGTVSPLAGPQGVRAYYYLWRSSNHWRMKLGPAYPYQSHPLALPATTDADGCNEISLYEGNQLLDVAQPLYTQDDPGVIERDIRTAKDAGLAGFLLNWAGNGDPLQTVTSVVYTPRLAEALAASSRVGGFTNWLSYKSAALPSVDHIVGDMAFLAREFSADPAWGRIDGKPVLVLTGSRKYDDVEVAAISAFARQRFYLVGDESAATLTDARLAMFDAVSYYWSTQNPWTNPSSFDRIGAMGDRVHAAGKPWFAPFTPGYNGRLIGGSTCVPRRDGATMEALWRGNGASAPDGWTFISWNEIAENSHVEPLTRWGDRYLQVLSGLIRGQ